MRTVAEIVDKLVEWTDAQRLDWHYWEIPEWDDRSNDYSTVVCHLWAGSGDERCVFVRLFEKTGMVINAFGEPVKFHDESVGKLWELLEKQRAERQLGDTGWDREIIDTMQEMIVA